MKSHRPWQTASPAGLTGAGQQFLERAHVTQHVGGNDQRPAVFVASEVGNDIGLAQLNVQVLDPCVGEHAGRQIDAGEGFDEQVTNCQRDETGAAAEVKSLSEREAGRDFGWCNRVVRMANGIPY